MDANVERSRDLVFQAEDDLDGAAISLGGVILSDGHRAELKVGVDTVRFKVDTLAELLSAAGPGHAPTPGRW